MPSLSRSKTATTSKTTELSDLEVVCCGDHNTHIELGDYPSPTVLIQLEAFIGKMHVTLGMKGIKSSSFVSYLNPKADEKDSPIRYINSLSEVPKDSFLLLADSDKGFICLLCLSHDDLTVSMGGKGTNKLELKISSGHSRLANQRRSALLYGKGNCAHRLLHTMIKQGLKFTGGLGKLRKDKSLLPDWIGSWGWKSSSLPLAPPTHDGILKAVKEMVDDGRTPSYVLIGEGWQDLAISPKGRAPLNLLKSFHADTKLFPYGLKGLVRAIKNYGITQIGVWHAAMGSRQGLHADLAQIYDLPPDAQGRYFLGHDLGDTFQFYHDYYGHLRKEGITFVEVGDQHSVETFCREGMDITRLYRNLQTAIQGASATQFNNTQLNSECLHGNNIFYWPVSRTACCDDSQIDLENPVGIQRAIRNRLQQSLWLQHLMLPTSYPWLATKIQSETLAIFHALSGAPLMLEGTIDLHHEHLTHKLLLPNGHLLRTDHPLTLCSSCAVDNPLESRKVYKAFTKKGPCGILVAFNLSAGHRTLHGKISHADLEHSIDRPSAILSHLHGFIGTLQANDEVSITLKPGQTDIFTFAPIHKGIAVLGAHHYYLAPGLVEEVSVTEDDMHIKTLIGTPLLVYCERAILEVTRNGFTVPWDYDEHRNILSIDTRQKVFNEACVYSVTFA